MSEPVKRYEAAIWEGVWTDGKRHGVVLATDHERAMAEKEAECERLKDQLAISVGIVRGCEVRVKELEARLAKMREALARLMELEHDTDAAGEEWHIQWKNAMLQAAAALAEGKE